MSLDASSGDLRKTSVAFILSVVLHASILMGLALLAVTTAPPKTTEPFPLYLGPIGPAGGVGASSGTGAPAEAAGGKKDEPAPVAVPEPVATPNTDRVRVPKTKPPTPVARKAQPPTEIVRAAPPSSGHGDASEGAGAGSSTSGVPGGSGSGGGGAGGTASYEQALAAWLDSHKYYPSMLRRRGIEGEGKLRIEIARTGKLVGVEVDRAFTHPSLESIAEDWVKRSDPFPPVPASIPGESYTFVVPVVFRLE